MSIEYEVSTEIKWDADKNNGRLFRLVMGIVALHGSQMKSGDSQYAAIVEALGNESEARIYEWQRRAAAHAHSISPEKRRELEKVGRKHEWKGSDVVTDINVYRRSIEE